MTATPVPVGVVTADSLLDNRLPILDGLASILPGLPRGQIIGCRGGAAVAVAGALLVRATQSGSWAAILGWPGPGLEYLNEIGVDLSRVVRIKDNAITSNQRHDAWVDAVGAVLDGFDLVLVSIPPTMSPAAVRAVQQRVRSRRAVMIAVEEPGSSTSIDAVMTPDLVLDAQPAAWYGLDAGAGYLQTREVSLGIGGRRRPTITRYRIWLPGPAGVIGAI